MRFGCHGLLLVLLSGCFGDSGLSPSSESRATVSFDEQLTKEELQQTGQIQYHDVPPPPELTAGPTVAPRPAEVDSKSMPIMFVHGYDFSGPVDNDGTQWDGMISAFQEWGWSGAAARWAYYGCDRVYGALDASAHGSHDVHFGGSTSHQGVSSCEPSNHDRYTPIMHLAYHWAWAVHDLYSKDGTCVVAVGHSMGGLVIRYALSRVQAAHPEFPASLCVGSAVTLGTPHGGVDTACSTTQSCAMQSSSPFMAYLHAYAWNPQGTGETTWITVGSEADWIVNALSATDVGASLKVVYRAETDIGHVSEPNYMTVDYADVFGPQDMTAAVVYQSAAFPLKLWSASPWPVYWTFLSLAGSVFNWLGGEEEDLSGASDAVAHVPTLVRTSPGETISVERGSGLTFKAAARDGDGNLDRTEFFLNDAYQDFDGCYVDCSWDDASWSYVFNLEGTFTVMAKTKDRDGMSSTAATWTVTVTAPESHAPTLRMTSPAASVTVTKGDAITFKARAEDLDGNLDRTDYFVDGTYQTYDGCYFDCTWDDASWTHIFSEEGTFSVEAMAKDREGLLSGIVAWTVTVRAPVNHPPTLTLVSPPSSISATAGQSITFRARAEDTDGNLDQTNFYVGGVYNDYDGCYYDCVWDDASWTGSFSSQGTYTVSARARDAEGAESGTVTWTVTVSAPQSHAPTLSRTSPGSSVSIYAGQTVSFQAHAEDADGDLDRTNFYMDAAYQDYDGCYVDCTWDDASWSKRFASTGTFTVSAKAKDDAGLESGTVTWTVYVG